MNNTQRISIRDAREQLSYYIDQVAIAEKQFIITKFGKPKALLTPIDLSVPKDKADGLKKSFGAWKKRKDIQSSAQ